MATATRASRTNASQDAPVSITEIKTVTTTVDVEVELTGRQANRILADLATARDLRIQAAKVERTAKDMLRGFCPDEQLTRGQRYLLKVNGVLRGVFNYRERTGIDMDLLLQAYPEAFENCQKTTPFEQYQPA